MPNKNHQKRSRQIIKSFKADSLKNRPLAIKIADALTTKFGTIGFLIINLTLFIVWVLVNSGKIPRIPVFDPYPYVLLITTVSLEAIILAIIVLISQNREGYINTMRDELQLHVNLLTEREITKVLVLLRELLKKNNIKISDTELDDMLKDIDTPYIERKLKEQIDGKPSAFAKNVTDPLVKVGEKVGKSLTQQK
ncbi:DUF1003 domain-containing protein [Patescibacteria group bacterium]|nr:DUF1003 domain-containing protein [Patescibacteria group bacterium]MBU0777244.1 DUF1003 domain-containing protein [Patescibacteria group bacterium]MBU0845939.1 DUF1003 domain-containing protein [Patescibacteria group bacterium]MBU0922967.1 DUF1003 domain-containing protein [Patescibacteria group bacterium]MBU1066183.1 DUF1003 domain-containing protein [Patescibacteria group bacterium]